MTKKLFPDSIFSKSFLDALVRNKHLKDNKESILEELGMLAINFIADKTKAEKNKQRIRAADSEKESIPASTNLTEEQIASLPRWVKSELKTAQLIGEKQNVIQIRDGRKYHLSNPLNSLSGGEWTFFLNSVINTRYPTTGEESYAHHIRKIHPSPKPPQLTRQIIEFFTKEGELVVDYFMGVGGTLLGASLSGRKAIGIDLNEQYVAVYKEANQYLKLQEQETYVGDSIELFSSPQKINDIFGTRKASLVLIDPPYSDMMSRKKTGEAIKKAKSTSPTPYTDSILDLGNMNINDFYDSLRCSVEGALKILRKNGHFVVFIKDLQPKDKTLNLLHADLITLLNDFEDLYYLGTKIWADQGVNLYPYGYPYAYVSNQIHQYILIFKKK